MFIYFFFVFADVEISDRTIGTPKLGLIRNNYYSKYHLKIQKDYILPF